MRADSLAQILRHRIEASLGVSRDAARLLADRHLPRTLICRGGVGLEDSVTSWMITPHLSDGIELAGVARPGFGDVK